jgi:hypothetical protein
MGNLVHGGRACPNCNKPALPKGQVVTCQNCNAIVHTEHGEIIGAWQDGQPVYNPKSKRTQMQEFVDGLSAQELTYLDEIIKEKKRG